MAAPDIVARQVGQLLAYPQALFMMQLVARHDRGAKG
jgi:hypothetical protein